MSNSRKKKKKSSSPLLPILALVAVAALVVLVIFDPFSNNDDENSNNDDENGYYIENNGHEEYINIVFRFPNAAGVLQEESRQMELRADNDMVRAVIVALIEGPQSAELLEVFPGGLVVEEHHLVHDTTEIRIVFSQEFNDLTHAQRIILTAAMVYTLTELDFVDYLDFFVGAHPVLDSNGVPFGLRSRANTVLDIDTEVPTTTIILYFMDENFMGLVPEVRTITMDTFTSYPEAIVQALLQGPQRADLEPAITSNVTLLGVDTIGEMVAVDFATDFLGIFTGGTFLEGMVVFSLVNSLTERPEINRVQILIEGLHVLPDDAGIGLHMDFSRPFERNEDIILRGQ